MKNTFFSLLWILLSLITFALLFPAMRLLIDVSTLYWPSIHTDINSGLSVLGKRLIQMPHDFIDIMISIPWPFFSFFAIYFLASKKETGTSERVWRPWFKKWQSTIWPIYIATIFIWTMVTVENPSSASTASLVIAACLSLLYAYLSYRFTKANRLPKSESSPRYSEG